MSTAAQAVFQAMDRQAQTMDRPFTPQEWANWTNEAIRAAKAEAAKEVWDRIMASGEHVPAWLVRMREEDDSAFD
jgi:hypothetical protein